MLILFRRFRRADPTFRNYAICVAAFIAIFAMSWWWLAARRYGFVRAGLYKPQPTNSFNSGFRKYTGPRTKDLLEEISSEDIDPVAYHENFEA